MDTFRSPAEAAVQTPYSPQGRVLQGRYLGPVRSRKGKLKGLQLQSPETIYLIKLPKYLRPVLLRELTPGQLLQVWAYPDEDRWRGINLRPLEAATAARLEAELPRPSQNSPEPDPAAAICLEVCGKGKCCKQGSLAILGQLRQEVESNPALQHVTLRSTGCLKACKQGPNLRLWPSGEILNHVTAQQVLHRLTQPSTGT